MLQMQRSADSKAGQLNQAPAATQTTSQGRPYTYFPGTPALMPQAASSQVPASQLPEVRAPAFVFNDVPIMEPTTTQPSCSPAGSSTLRAALEDAPCPPPWWCWPVLQEDMPMASIEVLWNGTPLKLPGRVQQKVMRLLASELVSCWSRCHMATTVTTFVTSYLTHSLQLQRIGNPASILGIILTHSTV